jgi:GTP-binding protein HflX
VVDREALILSIFNAHARTKQAQLQVELAQLKYLQSRLAGLWMGLSRQRGGAGGLGGRGLGETRLELDRRVVKRRISILSDKIKESEKVFRTQSARRADSPRAALVGYTNAGKSTLMRRLTKADVLIEDKLFATLDTTVRPLLPPTEPKLLLSDTVGFIRKLPHNLVASFRSTLSEAVESRIILHVLDASDPNWREHFETTEEVLAEIGAAEVPRLLIFNKTDALRTALVMREAQARRMLREYPVYLGLVSVSALTGNGLEKLREALMEHTGTRLPAWARTGEGEG